MAILVCCVIAVSLPSFTVLASDAPVPETLPEDYGGKTLYGYLMDLKNTYLPAKVFSDAVKYSDQDRESARRAANLLILGATQAMDKSGAEDQYNLYLRAYAYDLKYQDQRDPADRELALKDYQKAIAAGGTYAQADYDRLMALELQAAPLRWQISQILPLDEAAEALGVDVGALFYTASDYSQDDGSRLGLGYALSTVQNPDQSAVFVLVDPQGGKARYEMLKRFAFLGQVEEISGLGDEAVIMGLRSIQHNGLRYATALVIKDPLVLRVCVPDHIWRGLGHDRDPEGIALGLAERFLSNLFNTSRTLPPGQDALAEDIMPRHELPEGTPDSPVPDQIPDDLGGKTAYGYLMDLKNASVKSDIFTNTAYTQGDINNARRAIRLIVDIISEGFDRNSQNIYELEIRGSCYALAYADTGNPVFRLLALNDYKQALSQGYALARKPYDALAEPMFRKMADLAQGSQGGYVALLQDWLVKTGHLSGQTEGVFDDVTAKAVMAYESANGLTADGIADIALWLSLFAKVDDGDVLFFSE